MNGWVSTIYCDYKLRRGTDDEIYYFTIDCTYFVMHGNYQNNEFRLNWHYLEIYHVIQWCTSFCRRVVSAIK